MLDWEYHQERYRDLLGEAERERLLRDIRHAKTHDHHRGKVMTPVALAVGRTMVRAGVWLESFGKPAAECAEEVS